MASDRLSFPTQADALAGPAKGRGMLMDQPYVQQGARLPRAPEREREYRPSRGGAGYERDPSTRATSFSSRQEGGRARKEDLDGDLDGMRGGGRAGGRTAGAGAGSGRRESKRVEDLDDELEQFLKQR